MGWTEKCSMFSFYEALENEAWEASRKTITRIHVKYRPLKE